jgi:hypothetical protein
VVLRLGGPPVFYASNDGPFLEGGDWATLIELVNEDYADLGAGPSVPAAPTAQLLERFDRARRMAGLTPPFDALPEAVLIAIEAELDDEVAEFDRERIATLNSYEPGVSTVLIEFARGGPEGVEPPLPDPHGYAFSLRYLSTDILRGASALYVWVTPEESRRRNEDRAIPGLEGDASILHHGVPEVVMRGDYGVDDFLWLMERGGGAAVDVEADTGVFTIPAAIFDNRVDHTSFLRADHTEWDPDRVAELHLALVDSFGALNRTNT